MKYALILFLSLLSPQALAKDYVVGQISDVRIMAEFKKFQRHKDDVNYSHEQLATLKLIDENIQVKVFFAQWCHDSQREVPRLIQLFNNLGKENFEVSYYALDTQKSDPEGLAAQYKIKRTPTIIVLKDEQELGRVLEFPKVNWPKDLSELMKNEL